MATLDRVGYGVVEPNHLSAQVTGQIYAQLPAKKEIAQLENGQFAKYDYKTGEVNFTGEGEWMLVYNEVKLYKDEEINAREYAMKKTDAVDGIITPRLFKLNIGDIFTTNCTKAAATSAEGKTVGEDLAVGDVVAPDAATGYLTEAAGAASAYKLQVVKVYTLPDGQAAVKLMRIA